MCGHARASPASPNSPVTPASHPPTVSVTSGPAIASVTSTTSASTVLVTSPQNQETLHKCDHCEFSSISKHGVSVHAGHTHRKLSNCEDLESSQIDQIDGTTEVEEEEISVYREILYTISCNEPKTEKEVEEDLRRVWKFVHVSGWGADEDQGNFIVKVGAEDLSEDFPIELADHMLKTLPWPKGYSVVKRGKPRYL